MKMRFLIITLFVLFSLPFMGQEIEENILENATYKQRMAFFENNPLEKGQVIFLGNSLTQGGKWDEYFTDAKPVNRGISGDNTLGMLNRLHEIIEARPRKLFLLAGINDISLGRSTDKIMTGLKAILYQLKSGSPETQIYVQSLLPINNEEFGNYKRMLKKEKNIEKLNKELKKFCKEEGIIFIDIYPLFLAKKRKMDAKYTTDGLHLNEDGYRVWVAGIIEYVN